MHLVFRPLRLLQIGVSISERIFPVGGYLLKRKAARYICACSDKAPGLQGRRSSFLIRVTQYFKTPGCLYDFPIGYTPSEGRGAPLGRILSASISRAFRANSSTGPTLSASF